jgi:hypothetical protein
VREGDSLRAMFAVNNGATEDVEVSYRLYMSADELLGGDLLSPTAGSVTRPAATSAVVAKSFTMPAVADGVLYRPIIRVQAAKGNATTGVLGSSVRTDWIPLRAVLLGCVD